MNINSDFVNGADLISLERKRQYTEKGYLQSNDLRYEKGELLQAAGSYLYYGFPNVPFSPLWPWGEESWKPESRIKNLVKAGALIAAQIDVLLYKESQKDS